ncbi:hypothetical protein OAU50_02750, partial [Planctomycetota bacterium]|nr:hypothetical protein [Planctomycetota bacterium]
MISGFNKGLKLLAVVLGMEFATNWYADSRARKGDPVSEEGLMAVKAIAGFGGGYLLQKMGVRGARSLGTMATAVTVGSDLVRKFT